MTDETMLREVIEDALISRLGPDATWGQIEDAISQAAYLAAEIAIAGWTRTSEPVDEWERREAAARVAA